MKKRRSVLNNIMAAFIGVFIGRTAYAVWDYKAHPALYAADSAPLYANILVSGGVTLALLAICLVIKLVVKYRAKQENKKE